MNVVTDKTFQTQVLERSESVPVIVDLWAAWCGPCRVLTPILEKVVGETGGSVELGALDVDKNPHTAQAFGVRSIPSVFAFKNGKVVDSFVGARSERAVRKFVAKLVSR